MPNIEEIKAREQAATPGPWEDRGDPCKPFYEIVSSRDFLIASVQNFHNYKLIAHARTDIPALISEVERLTAKLKTLTDIEASEHRQTATLKKALESANNCIYAVYDAEQRGESNDYVREAIDEYYAFKQAQEAEK